MRLCDLMRLTLTTVLWTTRTVLAVNTVATTGTEFIIGLLGQSSAGQTTLEITSNRAAHVTISAPFIGLSSKLNIHPGTTHVTSLDSSLREVGSALSFKGVRVTSDQPIGIHVVDESSPDVGGYLVLPANTLGIDYMVTSYESRDKSEILVISHKDQTRVTIHLKTLGHVIYDGNFYTDGQIISKVLDTFQTLQIQSTADLTGTIVKSEGRIAVFSGGACAVLKSGSPNCGFIVEQMLPVETWKKTYVIPSISKGDNRVRFVARDDYTDVTFTTQLHHITFKLNTTEYYDMDLAYPNVAVVTSTRPISVSLVTGNDESMSLKPSMTLVPSVSQFDDFYRFNMTDLRVQIITPTNAMNDILMNNQHVVPKSPVHVHVPSTNQDFSVFSIDVTGPVGDVTLSNTNGVGFGAIVYGTRNGDSFSFPLGLKLDLSATQGKVRLVGGSLPTNGRVEYLSNGKWGTICGDGFDHSDANVICRMLDFGFGSADPKVYHNAHYGAGTGEVLVDNMQCDGTETELHLCRSGPWGGANCLHNKDVGVDCGTEIQLSGTNDSREGRLEVFYKEEWGTVCDDNFGHVEAGVVCKSLGYGNKGHFYTGGGGTGPQWLDDVHCTGEESDIAQCMVKRWGVSDCTHTEDVWVACYPQTTIRLAGGLSPAEGRLEVYVAGRWSSVCDNMFDNQDAVVVCRMLGYELSPLSAHVRPGSQFGQGSGRMAIDELQCSGTETDISDCPSKPWMVTNCTHYHDVGVVCESAIRLVNGPNPNEGRLEVYYKGNWGTVCNDRFDSLDAQVVCRQLGYPYGLGPHSIRTYGQGTGPITIDELACAGTETDIGFCSSHPWLTHDCAHSEDVGVDCGTSIRLVGGTSPSEGRVEVYYSGQWGTVCDNMFDVHDADVICDTLGYNFNMPRRVKGGAQFGRGSGPIVIDQLQCSGREKDLQFCLSDPWGSHRCTHAEDVGVDCGLPLEHAIQGSCTASHWDITVDMQVLERLFPNSKPRDIQLSLQGCRGTQQGFKLHFGQPLSSCNTAIQTVGDTNIYTNDIKYAYHDPANPNIVRHYNWTVTVICNVNTRGVIVFNSSVPDTSPGQTLPTDTPQKYHVAYKFYSDQGLTHVVSGSPLQLRVGQTAYVKFWTTDADANTKMVIQNCYASPQNSPTDPNRVDLLKNGCAVDSSTNVIRRENHESTFSFTMFSVGPVNRGLFIRCDEKFCPLTDYSPECLQTCHH